MQPAKRDNAASGALSLPPYETASAPRISVAVFELRIGCEPQRGFKVLGPRGGSGPRGFLASIQKASVGPCLCHEVKR